MSALLARVTALLSGEPLRFIVYGAALVVWLVVGIANALGFSHFGANISLTDALPIASAAAVAITEVCRQIVWSPASVAALQTGIALTPPKPGPVTPVPTGSAP